MKTFFLIITFGVVLLMAYFLDFIIALLETIFTFFSANSFPVDLIVTPNFINNARILMVYVASVIFLTIILILATGIRGEEGGGEEGVFIGGG